MSVCLYESTRILSGLFIMLSLILSPYNWISHMCDNKFTVQSIQQGIRIGKEMRVQNNFGQGFIYSYYIAIFIPIANGSRDEDWAGAGGLLFPRKYLLKIPLFSKILFIRRRCSLAHSQFAQSWIQLRVDRGRLHKISWQFHHNSLGSISVTLTFLESLSLPFSTFRH